MESGQNFDDISQARRVDAVRFAAASLALEGLAVSNEAEELARMFAIGAISLEELVATERV
ncbi:antitoxin VbhA family protein [Stenotrophomonas sp.]|uniref:antitoxin VbhA family protein n=1 Tax=Stenotrophomonas sp. TaxID=69392 RepID=UPI0028A68E85|nr:antitoxin VbhA family protein [Stenotrophomonas sp.]